MNHILRPTLILLSFIAAISVMFLILRNKVYKPQNYDFSKIVTNKNILPVAIIVGLQD